jgi:hypothetical protein
VYLKLTTGYSFPLRVVFVGDGSVETAKKATRMAIEEHEWKLYRQTELSLYAGSHSLATRVLAHLLLQPRQILTSVLHAQFKAMDSKTVVADIQYSGAKIGWADSPSNARERIHRRMDQFFDSLVRCAASVRLRTFRADPKAQKRSWLSFWVLPTGGTGHGSAYFSSPKLQTSSIRPRTTHMASHVFPRVVVAIHNRLLFFEQPLLLEFLLLYVANCVAQNSQQSCPFQDKRIVR